MDELSFNHEGRAFLCRREGESTAGDAATASTPMWLVEVDGFWLPAFEARSDDTEADVRYRVIEWDRMRRNVAAS